jgi:hypothetical protein
MEQSIKDAISWAVVALNEAAKAENLTDAFHAMAEAFDEMSTALTLLAGELNKQTK